MKNRERERERERVRNLPSSGEIGERGEVARSCFFRRSGREEKKERKSGREKVGERESRGERRSGREKVGERESRGERKEEIVRIPLCIRYG